MREPHSIFPVVTYGVTFKTSIKFPKKLETAVQKKLKERTSTDPLELYKAYFKHKEAIERECNQICDNYYFEVEETKSKTKLSCTLITMDGLIKTPPLTISMDFDYPQSCPTYSFSKDFELYLKESKTTFELKMRTLNAPYNLTSILELWKSVVLSQHSAKAYDILSKV